MTQEAHLSELILRAFLLRHSRLTHRGAGLTLVGSRFDPDTRRLLEVLARNRLSSRWLELEGSPKAEAMLRELDVQPGGAADRRRSRRRAAQESQHSRTAGRTRPGLRIRRRRRGVRPARRRRRPRRTRGGRVRRLRRHGARHSPRTRRSAGRRVRHLGSRTISAFRPDYPATSWPRERRCRRRSSAYTSACGKRAVALSIGHRLASGQVRGRGR